MEWQFLVPNLPVRNVPAAQHWYHDTLGLGINWIWEDNFGSVGMDHVGNMLRIGHGDEEPAESEKFTVTREAG